MQSALPEHIWHQGEFKPWAAATTHVMAHALHYGSSVFEGIRAYETQRGTAILRLAAHLKRFAQSAAIYDLEIDLDTPALRQVCFDLLARNGYASAYLRPLVWRSTGGFGLSADNPCELMVAAWPWANYLGEKSRSGVDVCVSSWQRVAPNTIPAMAKAGGNYLSSTLIAREARRQGFDEGIALGPDGLISEGAGQNIFVVVDGRILTPPLAASILGGITRDIAIRLLDLLGHRVIEQALPRELLYFADEVFLTGTASEIVPVRSVDRKAVGGGSPGPITARLISAFTGLFDGRTEDFAGWLEYA